MEDEFLDETIPSKMKRAVIAGASEALNQKAGESKKSDDEILQDITDNIDKIIGKID